MAFAPIPSCFFPTFRECALSFLLLHSFYTLWRVFARAAATRRRLPPLLLFMPQEARHEERPALLRSLAHINQRRNNAKRMCGILRDECSGRTTYFESFTESLGLSTSKGAPAWFECHGHSRHIMHARTRRCCSAISGLSLAHPHTHSQ